MRCPACGYLITDTEILREAGAIQGRKGTGAAKARDSAKMREAGRLGGLATARKRAAERATRKKQKSFNPRREH